jgi:hypothetical protein
MNVIWGMTLCSLIDGYQHFGGKSIIFRIEKDVYGKMVRTMEKKGDRLALSANHDEGHR